MTAGRALPLPGDLAVVFDTAWQLLAAAVGDLAAPLRTPVVIGYAEAAPDGRVMVLRACRPAMSELIFHTDMRSPKALCLQRDSRVAVVGYDAARSVQLRLHGRARFESDGEAVEAAWNAISPTARRNYATTLPPGARLDSAGNGQPVSVDTAAARANFARLIVDVARVDWLDLAISGHRRAVFESGAGGWSGAWRVP
ncbi:MAG TPA: pyridoxamine 5'-phosphate oxidase family protein [Polymorphobacter sp.]|nr:pyridoxamine 5'-phosphate oxidase family protein [Polymorphobacter sp.]